MAYLQDVEESIQNHSDYLSLLDDQEITQGFDGSSLYDVDNLLEVATSCQVSDGPHCLFLGLVLSLEIAF